ncbi:MAG: chromosomal replication initiator protein DnaA [Hyphomicrobium sp.]|uniref:chromosomal replication initiator protein DnaA n=1 Tax=Hyphomicrobium sp. TaxID=82 RepID=UPI003568395E
MQAAKTTEAQSVSGAQGTAVVQTATGAVEGRGQKVRAMLRAQLGEEIYSSWFKSLEFEDFDGRVVKVSVPVKFVRNWIQEHYAERLLHCSRVEFATAERVEVVWRQPGVAMQRPLDTRSETANMDKAPASASQAEAPPRVSVLRPPVLPAQRTSAGGLEGSPLDPRYTFDSFVVGASNRMAHAGATQVTETVLTDAPGYNPLYIHSAVGLGKSHLLQAIAWEVKRRAPSAQVLYLTAERFRYQFVEALRSSDPLAFKERFRNIHMLLIDDLEFLQGERTEQEFDHIINALLDGGKQVVVASARAPNQIERLNERMRSRLQRGLVTELVPLDHELRLKVLEKRLGEKRAADPSFALSRDVVDLLAMRLTENGRELEGAVTRLYATWQYMRTPITLDIAETVIRDLVQNLEPRRIKIEDILRIISRHYGVSKGDLLSQRRHRSVVWPRQIGMYLAKHLTARSLPEIGRRFGGRDHTTVLHAIRKIEGEITKNPHLGDELEELKRLLNH